MKNRYGGDYVSDPPRSCPSRPCDRSLRLHGLWDGNAAHRGKRQPRRRTRGCGAISFFQGSGPGSDKGNAAIVGGKYVIEGERAKNLTPGSYTVQIFWLQKLAKPDPNGGNVDTSPAVKQLVPTKYNTKSTLTKEVNSGNNKIDFELTSK
jgi:hypothetical protein